MTATGSELAHEYRCDITVECSSYKCRLRFRIIPYENLPLSFESGGNISQKYSGRVVTKLTNYSVNNVKLKSGTPVGYIVMQPFSLN